jgi:antitoxin component of RelBE/YafQ-DinJ toxin-antitoxin module
MAGDTSVGRSRDTSVGRSRDTSVGRSRRLLTFRLDGDQRQRLKARLAGEGRTMSEVVILGLQNYVGHGTRRSGSGPGSRELDAPADAPAAPELDEASEPVSVPGLEATLGAPAALEPTPRPREPMPTAGLPTAGLPTAIGTTAAGTTATGTTVVASVSQLTLPAPTAAYLRNLRKSGDSDLLSATLARLHEVGWPLRPLADALGISRQAVQARIRQPVPSAVRSRVPEVPPPSAFPRRRPALASGRRAHLTVKIDHALRSAAHGKAVREGSSLSQVIEKILDYYVRHGLPTGEVRLGDTTPTRPGPRRKRRARGAGPPPG